MPKILTTKGLAASLEDLIRKAQVQITLISYSFKISEEYVRELERAAQRGVHIRLIYGERINPNTFDRISKLLRAEILHHPHLHAKIYANESKCILGSMNFYDYSELNNTELGAMFSKQNDADSYADVIEHCNSIYENAKLEFKNQLLQTAEQAPYIERNWPKDKNGSCVRCGTHIPFDPQKPFCSKCFSVWANFRNEFYLENLCHNCGKPGGDISFAKPECPSCYYGN